MNKVAASWRGAGGRLPWPARSGATHSPPCRFPLALHALAQKRSKRMNSLTFNIGSNYSNKIECKDIVNISIIQS